MNINNRVVNLMCLMAEHGFITSREAKYTLLRQRYLESIGKLIYGFFNVRL